MKTGILVLALTIGLLAASVPRNVLAGDRYTTGADPEGAFIQAWVRHGAIETGALTDASTGKSRSNRIVSGGSPFSLVEIGGVPYRVGLDIGS